VDTSSEAYADLYYSSYFQFSKLVYLVIVLTTGFAYVVAVTLRFKRSCHQPHNTSSDLLLCLALGTALHFCSSNATLLGWSDSSSWTTLLLYNFLVWTFTFWLGLHWTYLDTTQLRKIVLTWEHMKHWSMQLWAVFCGLVVIGLSLTAYQLYLFHTRGLLVFVGVGYSCAVCALVCLAFCLKDSYDFHLHHYQLFALLVPLTMNQDWVSAGCQGFCFGAYCEGIARWGVASFFDRKI
jgi:hypothetical protein